MYQWWVFVHVVGVFAFLAAHGVSITVLFRLRREREPRKVGDLLALSSSSISGMYGGLGLLLAGGVVAGFLGHWWGRAWIWVAIGTLVAVSLLMYAIARPYYRRVGFVSRAMAEGSQAVSPDQFDEILRSSRPVSVAVIGFVGLFFILYLMMLKPSFGLSSGTSATGVNGPVVEVTAKNISFDTDTLRAPAGVAFTIVFDNQDSAPHNVAIYTDSSASTSLFTGTVVAGPKTVHYPVGPLQAGTYYFRCDVHTQMNGTFVVTPSSSPTPSGSS